MWKPVLARALPAGDGSVEIGRHEGLLAEGMRELLAFDRLQQERRSQSCGADLLGALRRDRLRRVDAGLGGDLRQDVLAAQAHVASGSSGSGTSASSRTSSHRFRTASTFSSRSGKSTGRSPPRRCPERLEQTVHAVDTRVLAR